MNLIFKLLIISLLTINLNANEKTYEFKSTFGFLQTGTILNRFKDARVAIKVWLEDIAASYGGNLTLRFYDNNATLYNDLRNGNLDMIVLNLPFYFKNKSIIDKDAIEFWSIAMSKDKYIKYYLIAAKDSNINSFKDIKGKSISMITNDSVGDIWIDKNTLINFKKTYKNVFSEIHPVLKESTALLNVFFKKKDLAVVTRKTWETMLELNPAIKNRVKIIEESKEKHLPFIGFFSKYADKKSIDAFFELSANLKDLKGSRQVIDLLKFDSIIKVNEDSFLELEKYYKEYELLQMRYK